MSDDKPKTRRPANTAFKQQRLKAWQPLLTPKSVLPTLFVLGVIFAPLGAFLLHASSSVSELIIDYTTCSTTARETLAPVPNAGDISSYSAPGQSNANINLQWSFVNGTDKSGNCTLQFTLPQAMTPPVFIYYRLTNFYQNHRRYVKSFDPGQLRGQDVPLATIDSNCKPYGKVSDNSNQVYYPCGLIANSIFNDTIYNLTSSAGGPDAYTFSANKISWPADDTKYMRLASFDPNVHIPPPNWAKRYPPDGKYKADPEIYKDERFRVWMRTAALPNFRKLYGRNDADTLTPGTYTILITSNFDVSSFGGTKALVISTVSFMGGKNPFLGYAYIIVGAICIVLAVVFAARHLYSPRKLGDHTYLSWNHQPPPSNANPQ